MSALLAWLPPAALAERALGPDVGGGRPSVVTLDGSVPHASRWTTTPPVLRGPDRRPKALLLSLGGAPCRLSLMRAGDLYIDAVAGNFDAEFAERQWARIRRHDPPEIAQVMVAVLGGEVVEASS